MLEARLVRDTKEWTIDYLGKLSNYSWEVAATEALRYQDRVAETDYNAQQERIIDTAMLNLELNQEALYDKYVTSESLRATQDELNFNNEVNKQRLQLGSNLTDLGQQGQEALNLRNQQLAGLDVDLERSSIDVLQAINKRQGYQQDIRNARETKKQELGRVNAQFQMLSAQERKKFQLAKDNAEKQKILETAGINLKEDFDLAEIGINYATDKAELSLKAAQSNAESMQAARGYMNSIKQRAAEADQIVRGKEAEGQEIQEDLIISERLDTIRRDAEYITAIVDGASTKASTVTKGGGSNSAQRAALDSMMAYGRSYGEMKALQDQRRTKLNSYNADLVGRTASQLGQIATAISGEADNIKYTNQSNLLKNEGFKLTDAALNTNKTLDTLGVKKQSRLARQSERVKFNTTVKSLAQLRTQNVEKLRFNRDEDKDEIKLKTKQLIEDAKLNKAGAQLDIQNARLDMTDTRLNKKNVKQNYNTTAKGIKADIKTAKQNYNLNTQFLLDNFNDLTVPGYELARRQGERDFTELVQGTYNEVKGAARPYRNAVIFDPLEPIAGLKPEKGMATQFRGPSWGEIATNAFKAGAQGAMSQSYVNRNGDLAFR